MDRSLTPPFRGSDHSDYSGDDGPTWTFGHSDQSDDGGDDGGCCENYQWRYEVDMDPEHIEDPNDYHVGGLHPVHLGDRLNDRYRVVHKLGTGAFGTVWLCFDEEQSTWRAVKLLTAHGSTDLENKCPELQASHLLGKRFTPETLSKNHIASPVGSFMVQGPNGTHLGIVYPLLGCQLLHVSEYLAASEGLLKEITLQLVQAMDFLHSEAKLCHGDFRPANIMFNLAEGVDRWPEEKILQVLGQPKTEKIVCRKEGDELGPGVPDYVVGVARFDYYSGALAASVAVSDFGVSFEAENPPTQTRIPVRYTAPEDIVGITPPGFTTDVWALMVTLMEIVTTSGLAQYDSVTDVLGHLECIAGPMPENYREAWRNHGQEFANGEDDPSLPATVEMWQYEEMCRNPNAASGEDRGDKAPQNVRLARLVMGKKLTYLTQEMWDDVKRQEDFKVTGLLPKLVRQEGREERLWHQMDRKDVEQFIDLLSLVFKWQPADRPLTGEILKHPWFDDVRPRVFQKVNVRPEEAVDGEVAANKTFFGFLVMVLQSIARSLMSCVKPRRRV